MTAGSALLQVWWGLGGNGPVEGARPRQGILGDIPAEIKILERVPREEKRI